MDCAAIETQLIGHYFATLSDADSAAVDGHLVDCSACLRRCLSLKHHIERGGDSAERPSFAARRKLRDEVMRTFQPSRLERLRRWFQRPIPLYHGLATATLAVALAVMAPMLTRSLPQSLTSRATIAGPRVDTSRPSAQSLTIF